LKQIAQMGLFIERRDDQRQYGASSWRVYI
jgi:hypothetical protein